MEKNRVTSDLGGAESIERVISGDNIIGTILLKNGAYYFMPEQHYRMVFSTEVINRIAARLNALTDAQLHRQPAN